jgi:hypothetical protein
MKRALAVAAVTPLALLALAGPAVAAQQEVVHTTFTSAYADTFWSSGEGDSYSEGGVHAALTSDGPELYVWQSGPELSDGYVVTDLAGQGDYTFTIDRARLRTARLVADDLATKTCTFDWDGNQVGTCKRGSIDLDITWTGLGGITRAGHTERYKGDGFSVNATFKSTDRRASADGAVTGAISTDEFGESMLGAYKSVETMRCNQACPAPEE